MSRLPSTDDMMLSVVVPAYNESGTIEAVLRQLQQVPLRLEVIAVDDASTDGTGAILDGLTARGSCSKWSTMRPTAARAPRSGAGSPPPRAT